MELREKLEKLWGFVQHEFWRLKHHRDGNDHFRNMGWEVEAYLSISHAPGDILECVGDEGQVQYILNHVADLLLILSTRLPEVVIEDLVEAYEARKGEILADG